MALDGSLAEQQLRGDGLVRLAGRDQPEHLDLRGHSAAGGSVTGRLRMYTSTRFRSGTAPSSAKTCRGRVQLHRRGVLVEEGAADEADQYPDAPRLVRRLQLLPRRRGRAQCRRALLGDRPRRAGPPRSRRWPRPAAAAPRGRRRSRPARRRRRAPTRRRWRRAGSRRRRRGAPDLTAAAVSPPGRTRIAARAASTSSLSQPQLRQAGLRLSADRPALRYASVRGGGVAAQPVGLGQLVEGRVRPSPRRSRESAARRPAAPPEPHPATLRPAAGARPGGCDRRRRTRRCTGAAHRTTRSTPRPIPGRGATRSARGRRRSRCSRSSW